MFYQKNNDQQIYAEITNPIHGGLGWGLGFCLWVPRRNKNGGDSWSIMREVTPEDIIVHLVKRNEKEGYKFCGISMVKDKVKVVDMEPPRPGKYKGQSPYYRIELSNYMPFDKELPVSSFFKKYNAKLHNIYKNIRSNNESTFYVEYGNADKLRMSQKYLTHIPKDLSELINDFFKGEGIEYSVSEDNDEKESGITASEPIQSDRSVPSKTKTTITRIIRNNKLIKEIKEKVGYECQICGKKILLPNDNYYSEGHHLQPLGGDYKGPDIEENIIILCPNHHNEFDYGSIAIEPKNKKIKHINPANPYHNKKLSYSRKNLGDEFLKFHFYELYNQL